MIWGCSHTNAVLSKTMDNSCNMAFEVRCEIQGHSSWILGEHSLFLIIQYVRVVVLFVFMVLEG